MKNTVTVRETEERESVLILIEATSKSALDLKVKGYLFQFSPKDYGTYFQVPMTFEKHAAIPFWSCTLARFKEPLHAGSA